MQLGTDLCDQPSLFPPTNPHPHLAGKPPKFHQPQLTVLMSQVHPKNHTTPTPTKLIQISKQLKMWVIVKSPVKSFTKISTFFHI